MTFKFNPNHAIELGMGNWGVAEYSGKPKRALPEGNLKNLATA